MKKCFVAAAFLVALILTACCACSNDNAGAADTGSQTWETSGAYTRFLRALLLRKGKTVL